MNKIRIKNHLFNIFEGWASSINDKEIRDIVREKAFITGGSIVSLLLNEKPNDYDIYFKDYESMKKVADYYIDLFNNNYSDPLTKASFFEDNVLGTWKVYVPHKGYARANKEVKDYHPIFLSNNAITLTKDIQLITRFVGEPSDIHKNYDFAHCTCTYNPNTDELSLPADALESIITKELIYIGSKYPLASIIRTRKFIKRGWNINAGQYLKMAFQLQDYDLSDPRVLDDQLTGVDLYLFGLVIDKINEEKESNPSFKVTLDYISNVIDSVFEEEISSLS